MRACVVLVLCLAACGDDDAPATDAPVADAPIDSPTDGPPGDGPFVEPTLLSQTGLYSDIGTHTVASDVTEFAPRWQLWSDGAAKRRWIRLPPGAQIDTSNMDYWSFPQGTKLWKEFSRGGKRIETRLMEKTGTEDDVASWYMVSFQWNAAETEATAVPGGVVDDMGVNDIPARSACRQCHGPNRNPAVILGFQALQLDYDAPQGGLDLQRLVDDDWLTVEPTGGNGVAFFPLPGGNSGDVVTTAVGYLHGNCGGCHNAASDVQNTVPLKLRLSTSDLASWAETDTYETAVNQTATLGSNGTHVVYGGNLDQSALYRRMNTTGGIKMPPVGREMIDDTAVTAVSAWITSLPPPP